MEYKHYKEAIIVKNTRKIMALVMAVLMAIVVNVPAFAAETSADGTTPATQAVARAVTTVYQYQSSNFGGYYNGGTFKPTFDSTGARIVVAAIRTNGTVDGEITVRVYKKGLLGLKDRIITFTCDANKVAHTSKAFEIKKNGNYLVEIETTTVLPSIVSVTIAA